MNPIIHRPSLDSGLPKTDSRALDVTPLLTTVFATLGFSARAAGVRLTVDVPCGLRLRGDRSLLLQVLVGLVTDAIHAVGPAGRVTLAARPGEDRTVILDIVASAPSMAPEVLARLWTPLFARKPERTGLAIAPSLVKEMGGTIQLESAAPRRRLCRLAFPTAPDELHQNTGNPLFDAGSAGSPGGATRPGP